MYTYTFPHEHFGSITSHMTGLAIVVSSLSLSNGIYTMICESQIDADQLDHMYRQFNLREVV